MCVCVEHSHKVIGFSMFPMTHLYMFTNFFFFFVLCFPEFVDPNRCPSHVHVRQNKKKPKFNNFLNFSNFSSKISTKTDFHLRQMRFPDSLKFFCNFYQVFCKIYPLGHTQSPISHFTIK